MCILSSVFLKMLKWLNNMAQKLTRSKSSKMFSLESTRHALFRFVVYGRSFRHNKRNVCAVRECVFSSSS